MGIPAYARAIRSSILSAEQLATYIESHQHRLNEICLVAKLGHEVIGVCNVTSDQDTKTSHIGDVFIAVSKPYWGNGVGPLHWKCIETLRK